MMSLHSMKKDSALASNTLPASHLYLNPTLPGQCVGNDAHLQPFAEVALQSSTMQPFFGSLIWLKWLLPMLLLRCCMRVLSLY